MPSGPGYPQTHVIGHRVAPELASRFTLVIADLPGYGSSDVPATDADHTPFTKRAMAQALVDVMRHLGHARFALAGHDRGGRVAYRMALDHPDRLSRLAVIASGNLAQPCQRRGWRIHRLGPLPLRGSARSDAGGAAAVPWFWRLIPWVDCAIPLVTAKSHLVKRNLVNVPRCHMQVEVALGM